MKEIYFMVAEDPEGGYNAHALGESIFSQGDSLDELRKNILDAIHCHFETPEPMVIRLHIVHDEILEYA